MLSAVERCMLQRFFEPYNDDLAHFMSENPQVLPVVMAFGQDPGGEEWAATSLAPLQRPPTALVVNHSSGLMTDDD